MEQTNKWKVVEVPAENVVILRHPSGAQAWFSIYDMAALPPAARAQYIRYDDPRRGLPPNPFVQLAQMIRCGLRPYRVDGQIEELVADLALPAPPPLLEGPV